MSGWRNGYLAGFISRRQQVRFLPPPPENRGSMNVYLEYRQKLQQAKNKLLKLKRQNPVSLKAYKTQKEEAEDLDVICSILNNYACFVTQQLKQPIERENNEYRERSYQLCGRNINR